MDTDTTPDNPLLAAADKVESILLSLLLTAMIVFSCLQIVLRTFFDTGLLWIDPLLRYLVLWCGFLGAVSAAGQSKHIAIDVIGDKLPEKLEPLLFLVTTLFSICAAAGLTWAGYRFLQSEIEFSSTGPLGIPTWAWNTIFPIAFALICLKYIVLLVDRLFFRQRRHNQVKGV